MKKPARQAAILRLVRDRQIASQEALRAALAQEGIAVAQATLSRDIRELALAKRAIPGGGFYYADPDPEPIRPDLGALAKSLLVSVSGVGAFVVLRTAGGGAGALAAAVDRAGWEGVLGTLAGDDTVLVIAAGDRARREIQARLAAAVR